MALFDSQFKGYAAMQNDSGPTLTTTAVLSEGIW
jgi:hypothetical protein